MTDNEIKIEQTPEGYILSAQFNQPKRLAPTLVDVQDIITWFYSEGTEERHNLDASYVAHTDKGLFDAKQAVKSSDES